jgi:hypothetical protein
LGDDPAPDPEPDERSRRPLVVGAAAAVVLLLAALLASPVSPLRGDDGPDPAGEVEPGAPRLEEQPPGFDGPAALRAAGYEMVFADEFDAPRPGDGTGDEFWVTAPFGDSLPPEFGGGTMTLRTTAANGHAWGQVAGTGPRSGGEPSYPGMRAWEQGYVESRFRYSDDSWSWAAFWLFGTAKTEAWPDDDCSVLNGEWDIVENGLPNGDGRHPARDWYYTALHHNTSDNSPDGYCGEPDEQRTASLDLTGIELSGWHTWGAHWTADALCTYLDGVQLQCMEPYDSTHQPMHLVYSIQYLPRCDGCPPRPPELEMEVDWVRVWQTAPAPGG